MADITANKPPDRPATTLLFSLLNRPLGTDMKAVINKSPRVRLWHVGSVIQYHANGSFVLPRRQTSHITSRCGDWADSPKYLRRSTSTSEPFLCLPFIVGLYRTSQHHFRSVPVHSAFRSLQASSARHS